MKKCTIDVEPELWRRVKVKCAGLGITIKEAMIRAIKAWLEEK